MPRFFARVFAVMHDCDVKMPNFTFYGGRPKQVTPKFSFNSLSKLKCGPQGINSREISLHRTITATWKRKRQSLKKTLIRFKSDVLAAVTVVDGKTP